MKTKQHTQGIMIILQAIFSIHRMSIRKNDTSNTYTFNNILFCIRKVLDECHPQTTDFTRLEQNRENVQFQKIMFFNKHLTNPYVH